MLCRERKVYSRIFFPPFPEFHAWFLIDEYLSVFLHAIFPSIVNIPDKMGSGSALTSAQMMCFFVYWYVSVVVS